ncbi:oxidoreductase [Paractinoplanes rishiriensis]|uniref:Oxidoreductase n=2 Tax=Paractinoplanes rishiriensis TaxID=1050105 RepID=A0A919K872_9ACTN|nr:oxidoreductase [Actinoplanes rishiriensis]
MVIGGGIGGLALAQGLRHTGIACDVYERTRERADWLQGYRIHINPAGAAALRNCLSPAGWQAFESGVADDDGGFGFLTDQCTDLLELPAAEINAGGGRHYGVSRIRLREVLLDGLGTVHHGREFTHYASDGDRVTAFFADGTTATADVLVGADGANSRVRAQLLPHAHRADTGVLAVAGKHPLPATALPPVLTTRTNLVVPRGRGSLFTAVWPPDYALWGFHDAAARFPAGLTGMPGDALQQVVLSRLAGWSPAFHRLVSGSDPATVNAIRVRSASPVRPWPTGRVTLLGDAIHNMTPMAGIGANTALRDADLLRVQLTQVPLIPAIATYERRMLDYGFAAVRQSLRNAQRAAHSSGFGRAAFRTTLRLTAAVPPIRRAMARGLGR